GATIGGPYGEPTPPPSSELSAVSGCWQGKFTVSETCDPRSLGRTSVKIEGNIKLPGSRYKVTKGSRFGDKLRNYDNLSVVINRSSLCSYAFFSH
ncbi:mCG1049322, isoform CRA_a, partial [Mus musculus]